MGIHPPEQKPAQEKQGAARQDQAGIKTGGRGREGHEEKDMAQQQERQRKGS